MKKRKIIHTEESKRLRAWLNEKRLEKALTTRQLAELLDWPNSVVGRVLIGDRHLDVVEYIAICDALRVNPCEGLKKGRSV